MIWKRLERLLNSNAPAPTERKMRFESLENRRLMVADPIHVGVVYLETDYLESDQDVGSDSKGDRFILSFTGGAPGTELTELIIRTDKDGDGISVGDPIFDTEQGGRGKNGYHPFKVQTIDTIDGTPADVTATVEDGGQILRLNFQGFSAGDRLEFTIDVDEVLRNLPDLDEFNQRLDVITSGQEFQDSILEAHFEAPDYYTAEADAIFLNDFGDPAGQYGLDLPPDEGTDIDSRPNRSAAAVGSATQTPIPASIGGFVYRDDNDSGTKDAGEVGLGGITVRLIPIDTIAPQGQLETKTNADGSYQFTNLMPGRYRIVEVDQPADLEDGKDAAGTIEGRVVGSAVNPGDEINDIVLRGGDVGVDYNFGEVPLGSIGGFVYLAAPGADCDGDHDEGDSTPLQNVEVRLIDEQGKVVATTRTGADGSYLFDDLRTGVYEIVEITPDGLLDGGSHPGEIRTIASNIFVPVGNSVDGGRITHVALPPGGEGHEYNFCEAAPGSLSGQVYHDRDSDGTRDAGEEAIPGTELVLVGSDGNVVATTLTDANGAYKFSGLAADTYRIIETQPLGYIDGRDSVGQIDGVTVGSLGSDSDSLVSITLRQGLHGVNYDFGERKLASLSGRVHVDFDEDCFKDEDEPALEGVIITLVDANGNQVAVTQTDAEGRYRFTDLMPGTYTVIETQPEGYFEGGAKPGSAGGVRETASRIGSITLDSGEVAVDYDFCERPPSEISGVVYVDRDADCFRDSGEEGLSGVIIELVDDSGTVIATTRTAADGTYKFSNLPAGFYTVREIQPSGYFHGGQKAGSHGGDDSQADVISTIDMGWGETLTQYNFCELLPSELSGIVYVDKDADCFRDSDEIGLAGVIVELFDENGNLVGSTTTDADGAYHFGNLKSGVYTVRETQPVGYYHGGQMAGSGGGDDSVADVISSINIGWGATLIDYDFCERLPSELSGTVYVDQDADCFQDPDEPGLAGVLIELFNSANELVATTTTDASGNYHFGNLQAGSYTVRETQPDGYFQGDQMAGSAGGDDSVTDVISAIPVGWGETLIDYDFCELLPSTISGMVWADTQRNSVFDDGETPLANVVIELRDENDQLVATTQTDGQGRYTFDGLPPGTYSVHETQPEGYFQGGQLVGDFGGRVLRSDVIGEITIPGGIDATGYDFPELPPATISGYVFQDGENLVLREAPSPEDLRDYRDGELTDDDTRLAGVTLELRNVLGRPVDASTSALAGHYGTETIRVTTDENGYYEFTGLRPETVYSVYQVQPQGFIDSLDTPGTTGGLAINVADFVTNSDGTLTFPTSVQNLMNDASTDPKFDAILQLFVGAGQTSDNNNFSEIAIEDPPDEPPQFDPPETPVERPLVPIETFDSPIRPIAFGLYLDPQQQFFFSDEWQVSWHLSVINGGFPRGDGAGAVQSEIVSNDDLSETDGLIHPATYRGDSILEDQDLKERKGKLHSSLLRNDLMAGLWHIQMPTVRTLASSVEAGSHIQLGHPDATPLTGDFNGDGVDEAVLYIGGQWFIDLNGNGKWDAGDMWVRLGTELDRPVVGDWDGDGKDDVGIFGRRWENDWIRIRRDPGLPDPANTRRRGLSREELVPRETTANEDQQRMLMRGEDGGLLADAVDHVFQYGEQVDTPIAGDWNGDGIDQIGVFRAGQWLLDDDADGRWTGKTKPHQFGRPGDEPIVGDFDGDGIDEIGVVRGDVWIIDSDGDRRLTANDQRIVVMRDTPDSKPIVGDFDGDNKDEPGYYQDAS
ncbi:carboxypeptidase regulatory-like domain-containing protein [Rhodopirellula sp. JC737]|nr:carboxypeptidase regulatory-like domain-containing protein [Rhodopirellula sp. JC737]